jgi:flagellar hook protein FlgE
MMRSLYSAISGLNGFQTMMDVLGNNIANVDTTGFKASRVDFATTLSQVTKGASAPSTAANLGGTNAVQIGLGQTYSTDQLMTQGSAESTGVNTDLMLQGDGFFVMKDGANTVYTRAGGFTTDSNGTLEDPATGAKVQGYTWGANDTTSPNWGSTADITIKTGQVLPTDTFYPIPNDTATSIKFDGSTTTTSGTPPTASIAQNLENFTINGLTRVAYSSSTTPSSGQFSYDPTTGTVKFASDFTPNASYVAQYVDPASVGTPGSTVTPNGTNPTTITYDNTTNPNNPTAIVQYPPTPGATVYMGDGSNCYAYTLSNSDTPDDGQYTIKSLSDGTYQITFGNYTDSTETTQTSSMTPSAISYDFTNQAHTLSSFTIDQSGVITGVYSNGTDTVTHKIAQIAVATFPNDAGLQNIGNNFYTTSNNSGIATVGAANQNGAGSIESGELEMSNVNLAQEFTNMIIAQRGFEANSRVITVGDTILSTVVNMKTS